MYKCLDAANRKTGSTIATQQRLYIYAIQFCTTSLKSRLPRRRRDPYITILPDVKQSIDSLNTTTPRGGEGTMRKIKAITTI